MKGEREGENEIIIALSRVFELTVKARGDGPPFSQTTVGISLITKSRSVLIRARRDLWPWANIMRGNYFTDRRDSLARPDQIFAYVRKSYRISEIEVE